MVEFLLTVFWWGLKLILELLNIVLFVLISAGIPILIVGTLDGNDLYESLFLGNKRLSGFILGVIFLLVMIICATGYMEIIPLNDWSDTISFP